MVLSVEVTRAVRHHRSVLIRMGRPPEGKLLGEGFEEEALEALLLRRGGEERRGQPRHLGAADDLPARFCGEIERHRLAPPELLDRLRLLPAPERVGEVDSVREILLGEKPLDQKQGEPLVVGHALRPPQLLCGCLRPEQLSRAVTPDNAGRSHRRLAPFAFCLGCKPGLGLGGSHFQAVCLKHRERVAKVGCVSAPPDLTPLPHLTHHQWPVPRSGVGGSATLTRHEQTIQAERGGGEAR
mmetsp:Transcript_50838/g.121081  ORF Transcript_50838/g.121081 Transcript_50838/m.121081 type:complete len:241 (+) Transcript_50838:119-841(+)